VSVTFSDPANPSPNQQIITDVNSYDLLFDALFTAIDKNPG
jgi:hypothetical protein